MMQIFSKGLARPREVSRGCKLVAAFEQVSSAIVHALVRFLLGQARTSTFQIVVDESLLVKKFGSAKLLTCIKVAAEVARVFNQFLVVSLASKT